MEILINTHEKLVERILKHKLSKEELYKVLKTEGYKGTEKELITDLLFAIGATNAYVYSPQKVSNYKETLTQNEYFEILVKEMNVNY